MTADPRARGRLAGAAGRPWAATAGYVVLALLVALWTYRAFDDRSAHDFAPMYFAGRIAWGTGHPEAWFSWTGTPFLAAALALVTRVWSTATAADVLTVVNVALVVGTVAVVLRRFRGMVAPAWWWGLAVAAVTFVPALSSVWWKQVNLIALVAALGGFELLRRGREHRGAALIALSLSVKPLAILLPFALLIHRSTRRAGALALGYAVAFNLAAQGLLAAHAGDASALDPLLSIRNFAEKSRPPVPLACSPENYSPESLLCRLGGAQNWNAVRVLALLGVALLAFWVLMALRGVAARSWEVLAFACALSALAGPIEWSHYQVMLAPLFVLLLVRFATERAEPAIWAGLAAAFVLATLTWSPYGTLVDALRFDLPLAYRANPHPIVSAAAQFAAYVLILTGVLWYVARRSGGVERRG